MPSKNQTIILILAPLLMILPWLEGGSWFFPVSWFFFLKMLDEASFLPFRFLWIYLVLVIWNAGVTWWIWLASPGGAVMAILANALLMSGVIMIFHTIRKRFRDGHHLYLLIPFWLSFEYLHEHWDLSWIWLHLGNICSGFPSLVRWYSVTGVAGGSLWILLCNVSIYYTIKKFSRAKCLLSCSVLLFPVLTSFLMKPSEAPEKNKQRIRYLILQPNIDPYNEKFYYDFGTIYQRTLRQISQHKSQNHCNSDFDLIVFPETYITYDLNETSLQKDPIIEQFREDFIKPGITRYILCGASTYRFYNYREKTVTSRRDPASGEYYDMFNTALWISKDTVMVYHKSKLVPGVEKMPFPSVFGFLEKLAIDMGGTTGSLGTQKNRSVFISKEGWAVAPIICYESVYSEYVGDYVRQGADLFCVITNDGWWGNTPGHRQHLHFGMLRTLEYGLPMLRSANTGISAVISENAVLQQSLPYEKEGMLCGEVYVPLTDKKSIYAQTGDWISWTALILCIILLSTFFFKKKLLTRFTVH